MLYVNKTDLFNFLILVSLFCGIRGEFGGVKEQKKIAFGPRLGNNFAGTSGEATITPPITVDDEKFDDDELKKLFIQNFQGFYNMMQRNKELIPLISDDFSRQKGLARKKRTIIGRTKDHDQRNLTKYSRNVHRKVRDIDKNELTYDLECYECDGSNGSHEEKACYDGTMKNTKQCQEAAQCYIELNPQYIQRGCLLPDKMNRTFICKCPLCNSNPSWDHTFYTYQSLRDWQFDNHRLQTPIEDISLLCKSCNTEIDENNETMIKRCKDGVDAAFTVCGRNTACFTNIDDESGEVSRGCISLPVYNSIYFFCNKSLCNGARFDDPVARKNSEHPILRRIFHNIKPEPEEFVKRKITAFSNSWSNIESSFVLVCSIVFTLSK